jgi:UDP-N-acetyl-D-mannosaminuronate dehydrogenase
MNTDIIWEERNASELSKFIASETGQKFKAVIRANAPRLQSRTTEEAAMNCAKYEEYLRWKEVVKMYCDHSNFKKVAFESETFVDTSGADVK